MKFFEEVSKFVNKVADNASVAVNSIISNRHETAVIRSDNRVLRNENKTDAQKVAYENGIDPKKAWAQSFESLYNNTGETLSNVFGIANIGSKNAYGQGQNSPSHSGGVAKDYTLYIVGGVILAFFLVLGPGRKNKF